MNDNNKLGLAFQECYQGLQEYPVCNKGDWCNKIKDVREYLKLFDRLTDGMQPVMFMQYVECGAFVVLLSPYTDNPGNYKAAWIYVPNSIKIAGEKLEKACEKARDLLSSGISQDEIKEFMYSYPTKKCLDYLQSEKDGKFGVLRYGNRFQLYEILGEYLYQEKFSEYRAVFLLDENEDIRIRSDYDGKIYNLEENDLERYCILDAPNKDNIHGTPEIRLKGKLFDKAIRVKSGDELSISLRRPGFKEETIQIVVEKSLDSSEIEEKMYNKSWEKEISWEYFILIDTDDNDQEIKKQRKDKIKINGEEIPSSSPLYLPEKDCNNTHVEIIKDGYETYRENGVNLLQNSRKKIPLKRNIETKSGKIKLANGKNADFEFKSKFFPKENSPLEGYEYKEDGILAISDSFKLKQWGIGALILFIVEIVLIGSYTFSVWWDSYWNNHYIEWKFPPEIKGTKAQTCGSPEEPVSDMSSIILTYLDTNETWHRDSLELYEETQGLFEALNMFDADKIKSIYSQKLPQSKRLREIVDTLEKYKALDHKKGKENNDGKYNPHTDLEINTNNYILWISTDHTISSQDPVTPNTTKQGTDNTEKHTPTSAIDSTQQSSDRMGI